MTQSSAIFIFYGTKVNCFARHCGIAGDVGLARDQRVGQNKKCLTLGYANESKLHYAVKLLRWLGCGLGGYCEISIEEKIIIAIKEFHHYTTLNYEDKAKRNEAI